MDCAAGTEGKKEKSTAARVSEEGLPPPEVREEAVYARFRALGIPWKTHIHAPVFTVEEAAALYAGQPGGHTKNLFLKDRKGGLWLVVARDDLKIDLNRLARQLGCQRFSFGAPELLLAHLGIAPGSVTPFALINDEAGTVRLVLDDGLLGFELLNFHPLRNNRTTAVTPGDLMRFVQATGHEPLITALPTRG
ncbi:MAG: prolyl-tRNA synthetase associated domain-containing protein [Alphaproteobacteria bacterium]|nr:prolyl-tRNA synthetase associated domain-containing protein [Alphaproteobacteria bacterium]